MSITAFDKLAESRRRWRKTRGEYLLRAAGVGLALVAIMVGARDGFYYADAGGAPETPYRVTRPAAVASRHVLLVASELDAAAEGLAEGIRSYFGAEVTLAAQEAVSRKELDGVDCLVVFSNAAAPASEARAAVLSAAVARSLPIYWMGPGLSESAGVLGFASFEEAPQVVIPPNSYLTYKGIDLDAEGLPFVPGYPLEDRADVHVLATVRLHETFARAAVVRSGQITYLAFSPFPRSGAPLAFPVAIDLLADTLGRHDPDPRVIVRLEDVNAVDYGAGDDRFSRAAQRLMDAGIFVHVAITPVMVDGTGTVVADIGSARGVLDFLRRHPSRSAVVLHGARHHRDDPRNGQKPSGEAYEFFFDDDQAMGKAKARRFARERLAEAQEVLARAGLASLMFEAPHLEMSPSEEAVVRRAIPVMMHPPLFFGRQSEQFGVQVPWITEREGTVYAPSDVGYVDALDERSVERILSRLRQLKVILPDPIVTVFYHPFMIDKPGRERDLPALIEGMARLDYRPVSLLDQVEPVPGVSP